ncbi:MAG: Zn-ribbon-containing protein, partial [Vibrio fluvialis]
MYVVELQFECFDNTTISAVDKAINGLMDALRYNGQVLGREFPVILGEGEFYVRAVCPEKESLHPKHHSDFVKVCISRLAEASLLAPKVRLLGRDINSEEAAEAEAPSWQVLYTTYVHTCSPLRSG